MDSLVGAGGWAYFRVPGEDSLASYARAFSFVEVNSTFYDHPDPRTVARWRHRVPRLFQFAVRANRDVTHPRLHSGPAARASLARTARTADRLSAVAIVLETPAKATVDPAALRDLIASTDLPCPAAIEARSYRGRSLPPALSSLLESRDIADITDFSREAPRTASSLAYGRMFGHGEGSRWEFTDDELAAVRRRGESTGAGRVVFTFHGVRMYKDSGRFLTYVRSGKFPKATRQTGLGSLEAVLSEDARFPATRSELLTDHGWRVIDWSEGERVHAGEILRMLPPRRFDSPEAVRRAIPSLARLRT